MARWRQAIELAMTDEEIGRLTAISRSRTEPARRVERAQMLLAYRRIRLFLRWAKSLGCTIRLSNAALSGRWPMVRWRRSTSVRDPGKEPTITPEAKAWVVALACRKAKELGYPHELWTTRLLARHAREHGPAAGHACLAKLAQGTVCKILGQEESSRTRCATTWNAATRSSSRRWRRCCASIAR